MTSGLQTRSAPRAGGTAAEISTAVLLATAPAAAPGPAALQAWEGGTLLGRAVGQLAGLGVGDVHVITRTAWRDDVERAVGGAARVHASPTTDRDLRLIAELSRSGEGGLVLAHGDMVTHREALAGLLADPRLSTAVLTGPAEQYSPRVRLRRKRVMSAASPYHAVHDPDGSFLGVLRVAGGDRERLAEVAEHVAGVLEPGVPAAWEAQLEHRAGIWRRALGREARRAARRAGVPRDRLPRVRDPLPAADEQRVQQHLAAAREDVASLLVTGLVREGHDVGSTELRELFWARPLSPEEVDAAARDIAGYDEDRVLLDSAVKANDGFFTTFFVSPYSRFVARWAARRGLTPNQVTTVSVLIGVAAAAAFATGERWGLVAGAVLLQVAFMTDCVDGQLARYTRTFSRLGAWLDSIFDRTKEYVAFAGLAIGAARAGDPVWLLAATALTLQTVRHMVDFSFGDDQRGRAETMPRAPIEEPGDRPGADAHELEDEDDDEDDELPAGPAPRTTLRRRLLKRWRRFETNPAIMWPRKMIAFPIGERFAAISITAALFTPRVTFIVLLAWGGLAGVYTLFGRVLRSIAPFARTRVERMIEAVEAQARTFAVYRDSGPLARALGGALGRAVPLPAPALAAAGVLPLLALMAFGGADVGTGVAGAVLGWAVLCGGIATGRPANGRLQWTLPPVTRLAEYGGLLWLAALVGDGALPAAFALLAAVACRSYDLVYRLRIRGVTPPAWVSVLAGGWDGRLVIGFVLFAAGVLEGGYYVWAAILAVAVVGESVAGWMRVGRSEQPSGYDMEDED